LHCRGIGGADYRVSF